MVCLVYGIAVFGFQAYTYSAPYYKAYYFKSQMFVFAQTLENTASVVGSVFETDGSSPESGILSSDFAESVPVLLYHGILNMTDGSNIDLDTFIDQMTTLKNAGYQTVTIDDFYSFLKGEKKLPNKSFLLTFDDGRKDTYYPVDPILRALHFNAVMFAIEKFSLLDANNYYLTKSELQAMEKSGRWEIESHTRTHRNLETVPQSELGNEIIGSKEGLEGLLGKSIIAFAFPFGELGQESTNISQRSVMSIAEKAYAMSFFQFFTTKRFTQNYPVPSQNGHYLVRRISVLPEWSGKNLLSTIHQGEAKPIPFNPKLTNGDGWINTLWGEMAFENSHLMVRANPGGTGSVIILDGSHEWKDYQFSTNLLWHGGSNLYLWARYQDDENYTSCNFGNDLVHVEETVGGVTNVIKGNEVTNENLLKQNSFIASIRVYGRTVECLINGHVLAKTEFLDKHLSRGGIGIKVWDHVNGTSALEVTRVLVESIAFSSTSTVKTTSRAIEK